jgi:hypothetical protein
MNALGALDSEAFRDEHVAITREQLSKYRRLRKQQSKLREQQHDCELDLQRSEYLSSEQKDAILARYSEVFRELTTVTKQLNELERDQQLREILEQEEQRKNAAARGVVVDSENGEQTAVLTRLSDVKPEPISWFWHNRIPLGKITILDGDPGLGKSLVSLDFTARGTTHRPMPDGTFGDLTEPAGVVILSVEDDLADTIRPRLDAAGADVSRVVHLTAVKDADDERLPDLRDLGPIRSAITEINAKLVIVDPLMAYVPSKVDSHRDQDIRRVLAPLAALASETGVAVLVIRHLNKTEKKNYLYRGGGSIAIIGAARSGLLVARDPDDPDGQRCVFASTKANLSQLAESLTYTIESVSGIPRIAWGDASSHTAESLLVVQEDDKEKTSALEEAKHFLSKMLASGPQPATDVQKEAKQAGISAITLRRARIALGIEPKKSGQPRDEKQRWLWSLPQHIAPLLAGWVGTLDRPTGRSLNALMHARWALGVMAYEGEDGRLWWQLPQVTVQ